MPQIDDYPYTKTVEDVEGFLRGLDEAITTDVDQQYIESWLAKNTWEGRARAMLEMADEAAEQKLVEKQFHL